ncbi:MAG TPA: cytochrome c oxidase assembly protein [Propionicimonas sp.]|uniref:cytochrome c oxidase assembly protein n=1 Tax=Propionicimonas sp. TaxID=1955623 RepID=UPI002F400F33
MSDGAAPVAAASPLLPGGWAVGSAVGVAVGFVVWTAGVGSVLPPLPARLQADAGTGLVSMLGDLTALLAAGVTLGGLFAIVAVAPGCRDGSLTELQQRLARSVRRSAQLWFSAAVLMTFANPAFVNGVPLGYTLGLHAWWTFLSTTPSGQAWLLAAAVALATALVATLSRHRATFAVAWLCGLLAVAFIAVTGNVSVGQDHDWATDAALAVTLTMVPLVSAALGVVLAHRVAPGAISLAAALRYHRLVLPVVVVAAGAHALVAWQALAGTSPFEVVSGLSTVGLMVCLALLLVSWVWRQVSGFAVDPARVVGSVTRDLVLLVGYVAFLVAANHLPPPRFLMRQTIQVNYLGYAVDVPATLERLLSLGRPNLLWVLLSVGSMVAYVAGVAHVRRLGGHWPVMNVLAWLAGWGLTLYLAVSGLWMYSTAVFSWHMLVHMTVNMLVPILCVLGAPFRLIDAASRPRAAGELPGLREVLDAVSGYRPLQRLLSPPVLWLNYVASLFLVYFTPLFPWLMKYHWAHQLMLLYFMVTGFAFFSLIVGTGHQVWKLPHLVRLALMMSIMPFHAIFAVGILSARSLIGANFYQTIDVAWVGDLMNDQNIAGQITWLTGEVPIFIAVIALSAQWFVQDKRDASRIDALMDGEDDPLAAYNEMLAQLAGHDRESRSHASPPRSRSRT